MTASDAKREVVFFPPGGEVRLQFLRNDGSMFVATCKQLKSRYFVSQDGVDVAQNLPIWGVFDTNGASKFLSDWVVSEPIRTFTGETSDAAVMFALARTQRG